MPKKANFEEQKISENIKKRFAHQLKKIYKKGDSIKIGIDTSTISKYLNGHNFPTEYNLVKIKEYYNVPFSYLFGEIESVDINKSYLELNYGIDTFSSTKLRNLKRNLYKDSYDNSYFNEIKLYVINELIQNDSFIEKMADITYINIYTKLKGINLLKESKKGFKLEHPIFNQNLYKSMVNDTFNVFTKQIEDLDINNISPTIIEHSKEYACKYKSAFKNDVETSLSLQEKTTETNQ